jgi:hypothetical protein
MKTLNFDSKENIFEGFVLSTEEMQTVRGGDGDPICVPTKPPIRV